MGVTVTNTLKILVDDKELTTLPDRITNVAKEYRELKKYVDSAKLGAEEYNVVAARIQELRGILDTHNENLRANVSAWDKLVSVANEYAPALVGAFTIGAVVSYGQELFSLGTEMDALANKARTVLGESLGYVEQQARNNATAMGFTTSEYVNQAAAIADLLIPMGFQRQQAAEISTQMINLSGALSEWTGGQKSAAEVSDILNSALLGEREQLKGLGISISQADVDAAMLEKGLKNLTGTAKQQAEAMVTLELVTAKSADAQTAYANGGDSLVRSQAELSAQIKDISEKIATTLIPVFEGLVAVASGVVSVVSAIGEAFGASYQSTAEQVAGLRDLEETSNQLNESVTPLINRYQELTEKAERLGGTTKLSAKEQDELKTAAQGVADVIPGVIGEIDQYGNVLSINADKARDFVSQQVAMGQQARELRKTLLEQRQAELNDQIGIVQDKLNRGVDLFGNSLSLDEQNKMIQALQAGQAEIKKNAAEIAALNGNVQATTNTTTPAATLPGVSIDKTAADKAKKNAEDLANDIKKQAKELADFLNKIEEERKNAQLDKDKQEIKRIEAKYAKEIDLGKALAANDKATTAQQADATERYKKLEEIRDKEIATKKDEQHAAKIQRELDTNKKLLEEAEKLYQKQSELDQKSAEEKAQAQEAILKYIGDTSDDILANLLDVAEKEYFEMIRIAREKGIATTEIAEAYSKKESEIREKYAKQTSKNTIEATQKNAQMYAASFGAMADIAGSLLSLFDEKTRKSSVALKALTLINIGLNMAAGIAAAVAAGAGVPFPGNLVAIASGVGAVLAGISQAKAVFAGDQKKDGGYTVIGPKDGRTYNADYIGSPNTGLLPPAPKLILANEQGQEYFVAAHHLRNPVVANHVRMIDNITRQYANGGYTDAPSSASTTSDVSSSMLMELFNANMNVLSMLANKLDTLSVRIGYPEAANIANMSDEARRLIK